MDGGPSTHWTRKVKEAVFADDEHIDVKKIKTKNMRKGWKAAKEMQEQSGFGLRENECTSSINGRIIQLFANFEASAANLALLEVLNKKCRYFWRLDEIFGTRPNNNPVVISETLGQRPQLPSPSRSQSQLPSDSLILGSDEWPASDPEQQRNSVLLGRWMRKSRTLRMPYTMTPTRPIICQRLLHQCLQLVLQLAPD
jgi:hypothetical protein